jgi:hypothetical protein
VSDRDDHDAIRSEFDDAVNMTASELERWLGTDESKSVGQKDSSGGESTGHESGRRIVEILRTKKADLSDDDYAHMRKVNGYVVRHLEQRPDHPEDELAEMPWTYSLRNWGHDPLK